RLPPEHAANRRARKRTRHWAWAGAEEYISWSFSPIGATSGIGQLVDATTLLARQKRHPSFIEVGTANGNRTRILALKAPKQKSKNVDLCGFLHISGICACCDLLSFLAVSCPIGARLVQVFRAVSTDARENPRCGAWFQLCGVPPEYNLPHARALPIHERLVSSTNSLHSDKDSSRL